MHWTGARALVAGSRPDRRRGCAGALQTDAGDAAGRRTVARASGGWGEQRAHPRVLPLGAVGATVPGGRGATQLRAAGWPGRGAGEENRTPVASLEDWGSTIELRPRAGFLRRWGLYQGWPRNSRAAGGLAAGRWARRLPRRRVSRPGPVRLPTHGMWRSLVARPLWERKVVGSNPAIPTERPPTAAGRIVGPARARTRDPRTATASPAEPPSPGDHCCEERRRDT